jgi:hypothetical protein
LQGTALQSRGGARFFPASPPCPWPQQLPAPAITLSPDPIFAAIDAHRKAYAASATASAEIQRLHDLADQIVGRGIEIPSMIEPGTIITATIWSDIEKAIPSATYPDEYAHHSALFDRHYEAHFAITGDTDLIGEEEYKAEWVAIGNFADTVPTTLAGLLAMISHAVEIRETEPDAFADHHCNLIENLATAAKNLSAVRVPNVVAAQLQIKALGALLDHEANT